MMTITALHPDIKKVLAAIHFRSETGYRLNGLDRDIQKIKIKDPSNALADEEDTAVSMKQKYLNVLTTDIYNNLYHATAELPESSVAYKHDGFIGALSKANHGAGCWEDGWQLIGTDDKSDKVIARKKGLNFWVEQERVRPLNDGHCMVKIEKECRHLNNYFYYAYGNTDRTMIDGYDGQSIRFYWNLHPAAAVSYIDVVTELLNARNILFTTKVLSDPAAYSRSDAAVLYIDRSQLDEVLAVMPQLYDAVKGGIKQGTPMFVKTLLPGLGLAEDPSNGFSFGISRSKLIAETLYDCMLSGISNKEQMEDVLCHAFLIAGISATHPYATTGNIKMYESIINKYIQSWK